MKVGKTKENVIVLGQREYESSRIMEDVTFLRSQ